MLEKQVEAASLDHKLKEKEDEKAMLQKKKEAMKKELARYEGK